MSLLCRVGSHAAGPDPVRSHGLLFSSCRRCRRNLVRAATGWQPVPRGFQIVWKGRAASAAERSVPLAKASAAIAAAARGRRRYFGFGEIVSMGVRLLAWHGADGVRRWRDSLLARHGWQPALLLLSTR
jgi:hypothetical protein